jgi:16S rRNA processing protein RimM
MARPVRIGQITACHGLQGHVKIRTTEDNPDWANGKNRLRTVLAKKGEKTLTLVIESVKPQSKGLLLRFEGYPDRTAAEPLVGAVLYADRDDLPPPGEDEFWVDDLLGLTVIEQESGEEKGRVADILSAGGQEYLEIALSGTDERKIVPFIPHFFPAVDVAGKTITVTGLSGFLEPDSEGPETDGTE